MSRCSGALPGDSGSGWRRRLPPNGQGCSSWGRGCGSAIRSSARRSTAPRHRRRVSGCTGRSPRRPIRTPTPIAAPGTGPTPRRAWTRASRGSSKARRIGLGGAAGLPRPRPSWSGQPNSPPTRAPWGAGDGSGRGEAPSWGTGLGPAAADGGAGAARRAQRRSSAAPARADRLRLGQPGAATTAADARSTQAAGQQPPIRDWRADAASSASPYAPLPLGSAAEEGGAIPSRRVGVPTGSPRPASADRRSDGLADLHPAQEEACWAHGVEGSRSGRCGDERPSRRR